MKAYWQLTLSQLRIFLRNRQVLFWTLAFPIFLMIMLGSFLGDGNGVSVSIGVVDQDQTTLSKEFSKTLGKIETVNLEPIDSKEKALAQVKKGTLQLVVVIPQGYENQMKDAATTTPFELPLYYNETDVAVSQIGMTIVNSVVDGISKEKANYTPVIVTHANGIKARVYSRGNSSS